MSLETAREKRTRLIEQCTAHNIPARLGRNDRGVLGLDGRKGKPTTIGNMRRRLKAIGITPVC